MLVQSQYYGNYFASGLCQHVQIGTQPEVSKDHQESVQTDRSANSRSLFHPMDFLDLFGYGICGCTAQ